MQPHNSAPPRPLPGQPPTAAGQNPQKPAESYQTPRKSNTRRSKRNATAERKEIVNQMIPELSSCSGWGKDGFDHYMPFLPSERDIEEGIRLLNKDQLLVEEDNGSLHFTAFPTNPANIVAAHERDVFKPLNKICQSLQRVTVTLESENRHRTPSCELVQDPDRYNTAETQGANFKIDGFLKLIRTTIPPESQSSNFPVGDLAVLSEYKREIDNSIINREQLVGNAIFCMNDDPRRMHIYGITIEDGTMAVWYFSRSHAAKSPDFDFTRNVRLFIRIMLSLIFATEEELGFDQTIQRRFNPDTKTICFVYEVHGHFYRTTRALFEHRSLCTTGRATRVWAVVEVKSFDELKPLKKFRPMVLKDVWLDSDAKTERQILEEIYDALKGIAERLASGEEPEGFTGMDEDSKRNLRECLLKGEEDWKRYFLTIVHDWQGRTSKDVAPGALPDDTVFVSPPSTITPPSLPHADQSRGTISHPSNLVPQLVEHEGPPRRFSPKRQYREVFAEVCVTLHDVPNLNDVVTALLDCVSALQLMFLAGWVHRDISSGNVLCFDFGDIGKGGKLADLEYAKKLEADGKGSADPTTGTAYFMAVEVQKQVPFYALMLPITDQPENRKASIFAPAPEEAPPIYVPVVYNFEHDMESIFWLLLWTLLIRFPCDRSTVEQSKFRRNISAIFQDTTNCSATRESIFINEHEFVTFLSRWLAPDLQILIRSLKMLRRDLVNGYKSRKLNFADLSTYSCLYEYVRDTLNHCKELATTMPLPDLLPCYHTRLNGDAAGAPSDGASPAVNPPRQVIKRRRRESKVGHGDDDEYLPQGKAPRTGGATTASASRTLRQRKTHNEEGEDEDGDASQESE